MTGLWPEGCGIAFGDEYIVSVTEFSYVSQLLHNEEPKPLPQAEVLQRTPEPGSYVSIACT